MHKPKGMQQTRNRIQRATLTCGTGYILQDGITRKPIMELSTVLFPPQDGYVLLRLYSGHDVIYRIVLSDELKQCEVDTEKLIKMFISKLAMETKLAVRLSEFDTQIDVEADEDEENVILMWLGNTLIGEFVVSGEDIESVEINTDLQGEIIRYQLANVFARVSERC